MQTGYAAGSSGFGRSGVGAAERALRLQGRRHTQVSDEFVEAYNCHCSNCRASTGSAFKPSGEIDPETFRVTKGADSMIVQGDLNGHHARRCGNCFSLLCWTGYQSKIRIPYGTLIDEPALKPTAHIYVGSRGFVA